MDAAENAVSKIGKGISLLFFALLLLVGLWILPDYGISTDETVQVVHAEVQLDYAAKLLGVEDWEPYQPEKNLETYTWRQYSMLYGIISTFIAEQLGYETGDFGMAFRVRHYVIFILFWLACIAFYFTLKMRFGGWKYPLIGTVLLVLTPRIFANAFYNPKDMVVLVFYVYATASMLLFFAKRSWGTLLLHALATGAVLNTRLPALILPLMTLFLLVLEVIQDRKGFGKALLQATVYSVVSFVVFVALFPLLWEDTFARIADVWERMAQFNWGSHNLIFNTWVPGLETPAWYIPAWFTITTPLVILALILLAIGRLVHRHVLLLRQPKSAQQSGYWPTFWEDQKQLQDLAQAGLGLAPVIAVIILESTLYNGWRHLYFIYPSLLFLGVGSIQWLWEHRLPWVRKALATSLVINMAWVFIFMVWQHPHQQVYFNALAGGNLTKRYDMDYWGLSYYTALQKLADETPEGEYVYFRGNDIGVWYNSLYLPPAQKAKVRYDWKDEFQGYYITNFRRPEHHRMYFQKVPPHDKPYFFLEVMGEPILGVFHKPPGGVPDGKPYMIGE